MTTAVSVAFLEAEGRRRLEEALTVIKTLTGPSHPWCSQPEHAWTVATALTSLDARSLAEQAWEGIEQHLSCCPACLIAYHQTQRPDTPVQEFRPRNKDHARCR
ncbi:hypothetical protein WJX73_003074 [Symbiochloris irregularis]|uniref:Uncharacterized protein n=1 Tax=Symbiochloris irregularis TaxID=706552 RepID=A0AAW1PBL7_9CHLO